jgi:predicted membrane protein
MQYLIGLGLIILWSLGFIAQFTFFGFVQIILITALFNYSLKKISKLKSSTKTKEVIKTEQTNFDSGNKAA